MTTPDPAPVTPGAPAAPAPEPDVAAAGGALGADDGRALDPGDGRGGATAAGDDERPVRVLFVCWGNICRSPTAEGIMRRVADEAGLASAVEVDSAGTSDEHAGRPPDRRAIAEAAARGVDLRRQRARRVEPADWDRFDLLLAADGPVEQRLLRLAPDAAARTKVHRMTAFDPDPGAPDEVPDPYYGGADGFQHVYDVLEQACAGLLAHVRPPR
jgi:protein-tyrosine phosphatase